jgi:hypothetical protein
VSLYLFPRPRLTPPEPSYRIGAHSVSGKQPVAVDSPTRRHPHPHPRRRTISSHPVGESCTQVLSNTAKEEEGTVGERGGRMPPKMRKRWVHRSSEMLKEVNARADAWQPGHSASAGGYTGGASFRGKGKAGLGLGIRIITDDDPDGEVRDQNQTVGMDVDITNKAADGNAPAADACFT